MKKIKSFSMFLSMLLMLTFLSAGTAAAQNITVSGSVSDTEGNPLSGVVVHVNGTDIATTTDVSGQFSLRTPAGGKLLFSILGFREQTVSVPSRSERIDVVLEEENLLLDELVVVGYGTQRRRNIVGAVENMSGEAFENRPSASVVQSLQGQIPGLNIVVSNGKPTTSPTLNIRSNVQSIGAGGSALVLIDGVEGNLSQINPEDVESISVLKDASSAAVYGARGAFGVVLVTTKKASEGRVSVDYNGCFSIYTETVRPKYVTDSKTWYENMMSAYNGARHQNPPSISNWFPWSQDWEDEFYKRLNDPDQSYSSWDVGSDGRYRYFGRNNDWYDAYYKKATTGQQHIIRVNGGGKKASFIASGRYYEQDGILRIGNQKYRQFNGRAKGTVKLADWLTIENNTDFNHSSYHQPLSMPRQNVELCGYPIAEIYNHDGTYTPQAMFSGWAFIEQDKAYRDSKWFNFKNTSALDFTFIKDVLTARVDYSFQYVNNDEKDVLYPITYYNGPDLPVLYNGGEGMTTNMRFQKYHSANANITYTPRIGENHYLSAIVGWNLEHRQADYTTYKRDGFLVDGKANYKLMDGVNYTLTDGGSYAWGFIGVFYRLAYHYKGRYLVELSGRYDGSSKFPSTSRWGFFPSASIGWRMSDEAFMKGTKSWLDNLKWRFSIGQAGNGNVSPYQYMELMSIGKSGGIYDGMQQAKTSAPNIVPENITWETASSMDLGVDISFLKNRLSFVGDIYQKDTKDMYVVGAEIPAVAGYSAPKGNNADMRTRGWEVSIAWCDSFNLAGKPFKYNLRASLWDSRSFITKYTSKTNNIPLIYRSAYYEGMELGEFWGYHVDGLFQSDEEAQDWGGKAQAKTFWSGDNMSWTAGDLRFADLNGDGVVDDGNRTLDNHGDMKKIGNTSPRYQYGFNLGLNWNGIGLSVFVQGVGKRDWYPAGYTSLFWGQYNLPWGYCLDWQNNDRWSEDNRDAYWPKLRGYLGVENRGTLRVANDRYMQNASYVRLKNLTVDYSLPSKLTRKARIEKVKFFLSGENLFYWSPMMRHARNIDPEMLEAGDNVVGTTRGTQGDGNGYPMTKCFTFGVNLSF